MINKEFLNSLLCPISKQNLVLADNDTLNKIKGDISNKKVINRSGEKIIEQIEQLLFTEDKQFAYVIRNDIPVIIPEEAIVL